MTCITAAHYPEAHRMNLTETRRSGFGLATMIVFSTLLATCLSPLPLAFAQQRGHESDAGPKEVVEGQTDDAESWRRDKIHKLQRQIADKTEQGTNRRELRAQLDWLEAWTPGSMLEQARDERDEPSEEQRPDQKRELSPEPQLKDYQPSEADDAAAEKWLARATRAQAKLHELDEPSVRKENLLATDAQAEVLLDLIEEAPKPLPGQLTPEIMHWLKLHTLYRQGRAIAYRELPDVIEQNPIQDFQTHDRNLRDVYRSLRGHTEDGDAEFVLLDVRMLRRDQQFGLALKRLEEYRWAIDRKWYLKKRRDLLEELGWEQPRQEAAKLYAEYQDR